MMTALGADVVQVRLPGRTLPRAESAYYDRGRIILDRITLDPTVLDPTTSSDIRELAALADVVLTDLDDSGMTALGVPVELSELRAGADAQVTVRVRSLGATGPNRDFRMSDITEWAASGLAQVTRRPHRDIERYVPVLPPGRQPQALAGLAAATAALAGRRWARLRREPVLADVSVQEVAAAMLHGVFPSYVWSGIVVGNPSTPALSLGMLLPAIDGDVYIRTLDPRQWDALMVWVDDESISAIGSDADSRLANNDALVMMVGEWTSKQYRLALLQEGQRRHIPIALPRSLDDVLAWQHLRARGVWRSIDFEGTPVEAPHLPLLEPTGWRPSAVTELAPILKQWQVRP
jgi:crotonobetainyl-CoA:carnitine CoA-transferase CaiB-like acyl-CoA transferase